MKKIVIAFFGAIFWSIFQSGSMMAAPCNDDSCAGLIEELQNLQKSRDVLNDKIHNSNENSPRPDPLRQQLKGIDDQIVEIGQQIKKCEAEALTNHTPHFP